MTTPASAAPPTVREGAVVGLAAGADGAESAGSKVAAGSVAGDGRYPGAVAIAGAGEGGGEAAAGSAGWAAGVSGSGVAVVATGLRGNACRSGRGLFGVVALAGSGDGDGDRTGSAASVSSGRVTKAAVSTLAGWFAAGSICHRDSTKMWPAVTRLAIRNVRRMPIMVCPDSATSRSCSVIQPFGPDFLQDGGGDLFDRLGGGGQPTDAAAPHQGLGLIDLHAAIVQRGIA
jgi:hypothetical protein